MGLGKSCELTVASIEGNFDAVLIICPASIKSNWFNELTNYVSEKDISIIGGVNEMKKGEIERYLGYGEGKSGKNLQELQQEAKDRGKWTDNRYVIINYDILDDVYKISRARSKEGIEKALEDSPMLKFLLNKKSLIIIDEAHKLSNSSSTRYKIIKDLLRKSNPHSVYLATGTPVTNNPANLYCLLQLIEENVSSDWQFYMERYCGAMKIPAKGEKEAWTNRFLKMKGKSSWYDLTSNEKDDLKEYIRNNARHITITKDATNLDELKKKISNIYLRRTKEDISGSLPNKTVHEVFYDFDVVQLMEYSKLWDEYEAAQLEVDPTKEINRDLLEGAVYRKYCSNQMVPKTIELADSFIEKGEKVIIATCYDEELNLLKDYYGDKCVVYNGKMLAKQKDAAQKEFIENEDKKVFIGNIIAAGVGINLVCARILIFNNIDFVPGNCRQMEDRCYRIGQNRDVHIYYQMFRGTQYERIWNTVMRKELAINKVIKKENEK
jgi:SNF2 family DNA or RNA helicase